MASKNQILGTTLVTQLTIDKLYQLINTPEQIIEIAADNKELAIHILGRLLRYKDRQLIKNDVNNIIDLIKKLGFDADFKFFWNSKQLITDLVSNNPAAIIQLATMNPRSHIVAWLVNEDPEKLNRNFTIEHLIQLEQVCFESVVNLIKNEPDIMIEKFNHLEQDTEATLAIKKHIIEHNRPNPDENITYFLEETGLIRKDEANTLKVGISL